MSSQPRLDLIKSLDAEAQEIVAARSPAKVVHATADIDSAGEEVEQAVRLVLRRKIPRQYHLGHGHIVDSHWNSSGQLDLLISTDTPRLFQAKDGTEYFAYESVRAVGEIKATYYQRKQDIEGFVEMIKRMRSDLYRQTPAHFVVEPGIGDITLPSGQEETSAAPFFWFMLFVNSGDFQEEQIREVYTSRLTHDLPNIVCLLDRGIIVNAAEVEEGHSLNIVPEANVEGAEGPNHWIFMQFDEDVQLAANFGFLFSSLTTYLLTRSFALMPGEHISDNPDMLEYLKGVFRFKDTFVIA